ncbi:hypothetical protein [uncultured Aquincola sp.]|uniref:hypothetical protein n=1 Tax=uncultured Aquincola sp. TaxID=886556 RepID=UPI0032B15B0E
MTARIASTRHLRWQAAAWMTLALAALPAAAKPPILNTTVQEQEVLAAQQAWGEALVAIGKAHDTQGREAAKALAAQVIDGAYGYQMGPVLFKPTLTTAPQTFRTTREGALAYFVGGDKAYPHDSSFALKGWQKVEVRNVGMVIAANTATTMGNVIFTDRDGKRVTVDKTWQFLKDDSGKLRIVVHHSSLPYTPQQ